MNIIVVFAILPKLVFNLLDVRGSAFIIFFNELGHMSSVVRHVLFCGGNQIYVSFRHSGGLLS